MATPGGFASLLRAVTGVRRARSGGPSMLSDSEEVAVSPAASPSAAHAMMALSNEDEVASPLREALSPRAGNCGADSAAGLPEPKRRRISEAEPDDADAEDDPGVPKLLGAPSKAKQKDIVQTVLKYFFLVATEERDNMHFVRDADHREGKEWKAAGPWPQLQTFLASCFGVAMSPVSFWNLLDKAGHSGHRKDTAINGLARQSFVTALKVLRPSGSGPPKGPTAAAKAAFETTLASHYRCGSTSSMAGQSDFDHFCARLITEYDVPRLELIRKLTRGSPGDVAPAPPRSAATPLHEIAPAAASSHADEAPTALAVRITGASRTAPEPQQHPLAVPASSSEAARAEAPDSDPSADGAATRGVYNLSHETLDAVERHWARFEEEHDLSAEYDAARAFQTFVAWLRARMPSISAELTYPLDADEVWCACTLLDAVCARVLDVVCIACLCGAPSPDGPHAHSLFSPHSNKR